MTKTQRRAFLFSSVLLLGLMVRPHQANAMLCGSTNVFAQSTQWMQEISRSSGFGYLLGDQETQCGMSGEDFKLCRKCPEGVGSKAFKSVMPMLTRSNHRLWMKRWMEEFQSGKIQISEGDFKNTQFMKHVRPNETKEQFRTRVEGQWGESYLFVHRQVQKMMQLEATMGGEPCFGPRKAWPKKWNDVSLPSPKGPSAQAKLDEINKMLESLDEPGALKEDKMPLARLGRQMAFLARAMADIYDDPEEKKKACVGDEIASRTCNDLKSTSSAHVNPIYWEIHNHLDSYIGKWLRANDYEEIALDCAGRSRCYQWKGTYTATYPY